VLAAGTAQGKVVLWEAAGGRKLATLTAYRKGIGVRQLAFSADGRTLATITDRGGVIHLWDVPSRTHRKTLDGAMSAPRCLTFLPDGKTLVVGDNNHVEFWDLDRGDWKRSPWTAEGRNPFGLMALSPDGSKAAVPDYQEPKKQGMRIGMRSIAICDLNTGKRVQTDVDHAAVSLAFSPDGKRLAVGGLHFDVLLFDAQTAKPLHRLQGHTNRVSATAWSADGMQLASGGWDNTVRLWNVRTGQDWRVLKGHSGQIDGVAFSLDGKKLASASQDGTVKVWDLPWGPPPNVYLGTSGVSQVAFSHDAGKLAFASYANQPNRPQNLVKVVDRRGNQEHSFTVDGVVTALAFTAAGAGFAAVHSTDDSLRLWDLNQGKEWKRLAVKPVRNIGGSPCAFSPDARLVAVAGYELLSVYVYDVATGELLHQFTGTGQKLAARGVAFSPDGRFLAYVDLGNQIWLWDVEGRRQLGEPIQPRDSQVGRLAFSPDGKLLAFATVDAVIIWEIAQGKERWRLRGHSHAITRLSFAPDGRLLASASQDGTVRLWDVTRGEELARLSYNDQPYNCVVFAPDGSALAAGTPFALVKVWQPARDADIARYLEAARQAAQFPSEETDTLAGERYEHIEQGYRLKGQKQFREAERAFGEAVRRVEDLRARLPHVPFWRIMLRQYQSNLGDLCVLQDQHADALDHYRKAASLSEDLVAEFPRSDYHLGASEDYDRLGGQLLRLKRTALAKEVFQKQLGLLERMTTLCPDDAPYLKGREPASQSLAWALATCPMAELRDPPRALGLARKALQVAPDKADAWLTLAAAQCRLGQWQEAVQSLEKSQPFSRQRADRFAFDAYLGFLQALARAPLGRVDEAERHFKSGVAAMQDQPWLDFRLDHLRQEAEEALRRPTVP
jgi:WD40 repeat protein